MIHFKGPLFSAAEIAAILGTPCNAAGIVEGIAFDSRDVQPGDLFVALKGQQQDGHDFIDTALKSGAGLIVGETARLTPSQLEDPRNLAVADSYDALVTLAKAARDRSKAKRIAVTGSAGKTSVVRALYAGLARTTATHSSIKSYNNHVGVPLSLARMPAGTEFATFEIGMNAPGEIAPLSKLVQPDVAIVTTVAPAHLAQFENVAAIADEKASIFDGLQPGGTAIVSIDHDYADQVLDHATAVAGRVITVSVDKPADVQVIRLSEKHNMTCLTVDLMGTPVTFKVGQPGRAAISNALLVLAAAEAVGADVLSVCLTLADRTPPEGRGQMVPIPAKGGSATLIDDSYNANPASFMAALDRLDRLEPREGGRVHIIAGDMLELGKGSKDIHDDILQEIEERVTGKLVLVGPDFAQVAKRHETDALIYENPLSAEEKQAFLGSFSASLQRGDVVLIKGSNALELSQIVKDLVASRNADKGYPSSRSALSGLSVSEVRV